MPNVELIFSHLRANNLNAFSLIETPGLTLTMDAYTKYKKKSNTELRLTLGYGVFFLENQTCIDSR